MRIGMSSCLFSSSTVPAAGSNSRRISAIIGQLIAGITAQLVNQFIFKSRSNRI